MSYTARQWLQGQADEAWCQWCVMPLRPPPPPLRGTTILLPHRDVVVHLVQHRAGKDGPCIVARTHRILFFSVELGTKREGCPYLSHIGA